ncbi:MAG: alpha/beta hydrolase [Acidimicrobiales bacterium]|nr:alpha/beta hydrolase [Acidimicrobiales bacterium]
MIFAHGFGCDQAMWRYVAPDFEADHRVVLFDHVGCGGSDTAAFEPRKYSTLDGYASDVLEIIDELGLRDVVFVGHSVSAMIGVLASVAKPDLFSALVLVGPSPRYIDDEDYYGGFAAADIDDLLASLESNYLGWSHSMAPVIMDNPDRPELANELAASFCRIDPAIAQQFAAVTFRSDNRDDLSKVNHPTLVVQSAQDAIASTAVGEFVHRQIPGSELVVLDVSGHCPNLSAPGQTSAAIANFIGGLSVAA